MNERDRKAAIAAARANPQPAIRNTIRPVVETVRAETIPQQPVVAPAYSVPSEEDRTAQVRILRAGTYYPGRMQDPTSWEEIEIVFAGDVIRCWRWNESGYVRDGSGLDMECSDLADIDEWYEPENPVRDFRHITPRRERNFRHVADMLDELKREGCVCLR